MRAPGFWREDGVLPVLLSPLSAAAAAVTARRVARPGWRAPVPVICCGNVTVGGAGKTTVALSLARLLTENGHVVHVLLRGYGGSMQGPRRVAPGDDAGMTGDEALLLAAVAPTWIGADRAVSARAAVTAGAGLLLMDDGLQNPGLHKDLSLLVVDGASGFGNGRVLPAGPLREPVAAGAARCQAAVIIGPDQSGTAGLLPAFLPVLHARLSPVRPAVFAGRKVLAFAGIAMPEKFFRTLREIGADIVARVPLPDHHRYHRRELGLLLDQAKALGAAPVTTAKDAVRLPPEIRQHVEVLEVTLTWDDPAELDALLRPVLRS
jgi:tetraacyldisaccharide 4'-kinase